MGRAGQRGTSAGPACAAVSFADLARADVEPKTATGVSGERVTIAAYTGRSRSLIGRSTRTVASKKPWKSHSKKRKVKTARWKEVEEVAAMIERTLDPAADVVHNAWLPELVSGQERQCDVVVRSGPEHRRTVSIVEVQDRGKSVDIGTLDGWIGKMRAVGAQHLICVSAEGFQSGAIQRAREVGPTIRLCTLQEIERDRWPVFAVGGSLLFVIHDIGAFTNVELLTNDTSKQGVSGNINFDDRRFRHPGGEVLSLNDIAKRAIMFHSGPRRPPGEHQFAFKTNEHYIFTRDDGITESVRLLLAGKDTVRHVPVPIDMLEYSQLDGPQAIAWVMEARVVDKTEHVARVTFRPRSDGRLEPDMGTISFSGLRPGDNFSVQLGDGQIHVVAIPVVE